MQLLVDQHARCRVHVPLPAPLQTLSVFKHFSPVANAGQSSDDRHAVAVVIEHRPQPVVGSPEQTGESCLV